MSIQLSWVANKTCAIIIIIKWMKYIINNTIVYVRTFPTDTNQI